MERTEKEIQIRRKGGLLRSLLIVALSLGIENANEKLAKNYLPGQSLSEEEFCKAAKKLHLKVTSQKVAFNEALALVPPIVTRLRDERYVVLGNRNQEQVLVFYPEEDKPMLVPFEKMEQEWAGMAYTFKKEFSFEELAHKFNFSWFMPVVLRYKRFLYEVIAASFFLQLFGLVMPLFTQVIVDKVIGNNGLATLDVLALALIFAGLFQAVMGILRTYLLTHTTNKMDVLLGARLFRHVIALPLQYFERRRVGDTLMRIASMNSIREFLTGSALTSLLDAFFVFVFIGIMLYYSVPLTMIALLALPVYLIQNVVATPLYQKRLQEVWNAGAESNSFLVESVTGIQTVKSMALEPQFNHQWEKRLATYVQKTFNSGVLNMFLGNSGSLIEKLAGFGVLWYGGNMVMAGEFTLGQLIAFQMISGQASAPLLRLVGLWQTVQQAILSVERLGDILHTRPEILRSAKENRNLQLIQGRVAFKDVTFRYLPNCEPALNEINLEIPAGSRIGVVGRSGSGKSTLTKLIQRLYIPEKGVVEIDGVSVAEMEPNWLRRQTGVVLQENYLFSGSVRENIAIAAPSTSMDAIIQVAKIAGAHEFILELPEGYDTKVGERGAALSGGQRQRIAIARALLSNPRILIFDEATSALDYESENIIMNNLHEIAVGRTLIMIAHRLSTVRHCDYIIVVDKGRIVEKGSHAELIRQNGLYSQLYLQQEDDDNASEG